MAKLSSDRKYVTVERGDTLTQIAVDYAGGYSKYKQLAAINNISNPDLIYIGQKIYLTSSGSGSGSSTTNKPTSNMATITAFGPLSTEPDKLFATWTWDKQSQTESYKVLWRYTTVDGIEFVGSNSTITVDSDYYAGSRQSTFDIPDGAVKVSFQVKPISKTYKKNDKDVTYWTAEWSTKKTYTNSTPLTAPDTPNLVAEGTKLTASIDDVSDILATKIEFKLVKNNTTIVGNKTASINTKTGYVSCVWPTVDAGSEYKVYARAVKDKLYSDWSSPSNAATTAPAPPSSITSYKATSETSVYLEWKAVTSAETYEIEYATKKSYFDNTDQTTIKSGIENTNFEFIGLEAGKEYFFRVRAVNKQGESEWTEIVSVVIGSDPVAPTTWSSTTTAIVGEAVNLYWVHNCADGSSQTYADLEITIGGVKETHTIKNSTEEDEKDMTSVYSIDTTGYSEGVQIQWRVRTAGVTLKYGDWSVLRTIDIYAQPALELSFTDKDGESIETLTAFPAFIKGIPGPKTQAPIGYHVSVVSNSVYETVDNVGVRKYVNAGEAVYSKHLDIASSLLLEMSAGVIDLANNCNYTIICTVSMNSGLAAEARINFTVGWAEQIYIPNAEVAVDDETLAAHIRPYCEDSTITNYQVQLNDGDYILTNTAVGAVFGDIVPNTFTDTGEPVYSGISEDDDEIFYTPVITATIVEGVTLSVYRREFDGTFVEIATGLDNSKNTTVTDPHPALDFARYRIVATAEDTGAVGYYDLSVPVSCDAAVIQWAEEWSNFETTEEDALAQPAWSGSMLKLLYNLDVSESTSPDVELVKYIGRKREVSYYGTHVGGKYNWNVDVLKSDKETLYALRRLQNWMGDVYVREPSGTGYWASITVSFNQTHAEKIVPVTLSLTRVEGGI